MKPLSTQTTTDREGPVSAPEKPLYRASWFDHLFDWVRAAPMPHWLFYLSLWMLLILLFRGLAWLEGVPPTGLSLLIATDEALYIVYYLALMHYLDSTARRALAQFRPLLQTSDGGFHRLSYELTTMPARNTLLAAGMGLVVTLISFRFMPTDAALAEVVRRLSTQLAFLLGNAILAVFIYHTFHQLRMVGRIHTTVTHLDLYRRGPVYAFSRLTARTAFGWILGISLGLSPRLAPLLTAENLILLWVPLLLLAALVFTLPLVGVHRLLAREKVRRQDEVEQRVEAVLVRVHGQQDAGDMNDLGGLKTLLDTLLVERELVAKLPTWPWQPGTLAGFTSALLLPIIIWLLQQILVGWLPGE